MKITSCVVLAFFCFGAAAFPANELSVLKAARMFDGKSNSLVQNGVVAVKGDKIFAIPLTCGKSPLRSESRSAD